MSEKWKDFWFDITHWWLSNSPTHYGYDAWLREQLAKPNPISKRAEHTVEISGYKIWISNYPYAFGGIYGRGPQVLPRKRTRKMLYDMIGIPE